MIELLRPIETFLGERIGSGFGRDLLFLILRPVHLYWPDYTDYVLFGLLFIPLFHLIPKAWRIGYLLLASALMIGWAYGFDFALALILFPILLRVTVRRLAPRACADPPFRKRAIAVLTVASLVAYGLLLAYETFEWQAEIPGSGYIFSPPLLHVCGVAFMLPKVIHYIVEGLRGVLPVQSAARTILYFIFFPILRLGPIERFPAFARGLDALPTARFAPFDIGYGLFRLASGGLKIALYTAWLYPFREYATLHYDQLHFAWTYPLLYIGFLEVWCHFGGYTDMAVGMSRLLGFRVTENFHFPIFSPNIGELWRRWHISLSLWLRDYVYLPLGGERGGHALRNAFITFALCGLWHQFSLNFLIWGVAQAVGMMGWRAWSNLWMGVERAKASWPRLNGLQRALRARPRLQWGLSVFVTLHYFALTGVFFMGPWDRALVFILRLLTLQ